MALVTKGIQFAKLQLIACLIDSSSVAQSFPQMPLSGQDDEEDRAAHGVHGVQAAHPGAAEAGEALRAGRRQEEEGADDPVLT